MSRYIYPVEYTFNQSYNEVINSIKSIFLLLSTKSPFVYNVSVLYQCDIYNELMIQQNYKKIGGILHHFSMHYEHLYNFKEFIEYHGIPFIPLRTMVQYLLSDFF